MNKEYDKTPSFYNDEETFSKFLKKTSFYTALQNNLSKCISFAKPKKILELGSATGETSMKVAKEFPSSTVVGVDMRQNIVEVANNAAKRENVKNVSFKQGDMSQYVKNPIDADFVYMLYSFHHIVDPEENKINFFKDAYQNLKKGAYVCIAEGFIPEDVSLTDEDPIVELWRVRSQEAYATVFWNSLSDLTKDSLDKATAIANYSKEKEFEAGLLVAKRDSEYLVKASWVEKVASEVGFKVVINQPVNNIADRIILLQK